MPKSSIRVCHPENRSRLQVLSSPGFRPLSDLFPPAIPSPVGSRYAVEASFQAPLNLSLKPYGRAANSPFISAPHVDAHPFRHVQRPVVARYPVMMFGYTVSVLAHVAVFHPHLRCLPSAGTPSRIPVMNTAVRFPLVVHNRRWSVTQFCTASVDEIISRLVP